MTIQKCLELWQTSWMAPRWHFVLTASRYVVLANGTPLLGCTHADVNAPDPSSDVMPTSSEVSATAETKTRLPRLVVFSKTAEYRHESIGEGLATLSALALTNGWEYTATEDAAQFTARLAAANVAVFLSTTGDVLDAAQQTAFEQFIGAGNGYVGIHGASDTEYDWPWYGSLVGAYFKAHPSVQRATLHVETTSHASTAHLATTWTRTDEWYGFRTNPRANVHVLLTLDESSYTPGDGAMGVDHPIAWYHEFAGGRAFYTALGHTTESYRDEAFKAHLEGAIRWASGAN